MDLRPGKATGDVPAEGRLSLMVGFAPSLVSDPRALGGLQPFVTEPRDALCISAGQKPGSSGLPSAKSSSLAVSSSPSAWRCTHIRRQDIHQLGTCPK